MDKAWHKIIFKILIWVCSLYGCFLIGKYIYFFTFEWGREFGNVSSFIVQLAIQALLVLSAVFALKQKNVLPICLTIVPLLFLNIVYFAPRGIISITNLKNIVEQYIKGMTSFNDLVFLIVEIIFVSIVFLLTYTEISICIYRIVKNKQLTSKIDDSENKSDSVTVPIIEEKIT